MRQDNPYAGFERVAPGAPAASPASSYAGFQPVSPQPAAAQPQRPAQPRPQAVSPATPAPVLNELGITDAEERDALIYQGYTPEEADRLMQENYVARSGPVVGYGVAREEELSPQDTPESLRAQGYEIDPVTNRWVRTVGRQQAPGAPAPVLPKLSELAARQAAEASLSQGEDTGLSDRVRAVSSGLSFGLSDELERALVEAQTRGENLNRRILGQEIPYTASEYGAAYEGLASGRANQFAQERPLQNFALQMAGGALAPGIGAAGGYVAQGATGGIRAGRAAGVGAGIGGATGFGTAEGGLADRLQSGAVGAGVGALTGAVGQRVVDRFARGAVGADTTAARELSREGVQLTPGQMLQETPVVGGAIRATEDRMAGFPIVGDFIQSARRRGIETANTAAVNRALAPLGERLPAKVSPGYEAVEYAQDQLGRAYADVLSRVNVTVDPPLQTGIAQVLADAPASMGQARAEQLAEILSSRVMRNVDPSTGAIPGDEFKRIETVLGQQQRELVRSMDGDQRALGQALGDIRSEFRDALARQNPVEAPRLQQINTGYANLVRVEDAAGASGSIAREGVFTPAQLAAAVRRNTGSRSQRGSGSGLMRDLATNMGEVLPSTVPDSGTAGRVGLAAGLGGVSMFKPEIAIPLIAGASAPYTKIGQSLINAIYRASDPEQARPALAEMARLAQRNPELQQYYAQAVEHVAQLAQPDVQNPPQTTLRVQP
jgi:hypothetical protein